MPRKSPFPKPRDSPRRCQGGDVHDIVSLIDAHDVMDRLADRLIAAARPGRTAPAACRALMAELARRLERHLEDERDFLHGDRDEAAGGAFDAEMRAFEAGFAELARHWRGYVDRWDEAGIAARRAAYANETADMMTALKLRRARACAVLYPLALDSGRIVWRPPH